jgi:hypothetical protein
MKTNNDVDALERLTVQLNSLHDEVAQLAKKSPNDGVNAFKLRLINKVIADGNAVLGQNYRPFSDFEQFDSDDVPTNSDVTIILGQYIEQVERYRSDNVIYHERRWVYVIAGKPSAITSVSPSKIGGKK